MRNDGHRGWECRAYPVSISNAGQENHRGDVFLAPCCGEGSGAGPLSVRALSRAAKASGFIICAAFWPTALSASSADIAVKTSFFDQSAAYEMLTFMGPDLREGVTALRARRPPDFPSAR